MAGVILAVGVLSAEASTQINWTSSGATVYNATGTSLLPGNRSSTGYLTSGYVELLYVGTDGWDGFTASGDGTIDDDLFVGSSWIGQGAPVVGSPNGRFGLTQTPHTYPDGSKFMIMWFDTPSPNYSSHLVPTTGNYGYYDNGGAYFTSTASAIDSFSLAAGGKYTTALPVPEPAVLSLFGIGLAAILIRRKARK